MNSPLFEVELCQMHHIFTFSHRANADCCVTQGPPPVYLAVHEAAVCSLVFGPCWGHWGNGSGYSGEAPQKPALSAHRQQHARLNTTGKLSVLFRNVLLACENIYIFFFTF